MNKNDHSQYIIRCINRAEVKYILVKDSFYNAINCLYTGVSIIIVLITYFK